MSAPWFEVQDDGDPPWAPKYSPFSAFGYVTCPKCRTGGIDPDSADTFVDAVLPTLSAAPGLAALFDQAKIDIQFDFVYTNANTNTETHDVGNLGSSHSIFHRVEAYDTHLTSDVSGTINIPTVDTSDLGPFAPFELGGNSSGFDDPDKRWARGYVWKSTANIPEKSLTPSMSEDTEVHHTIIWSRVTDCTTPADTQPSDTDETHSHALVSSASLRYVFIRVCKTGSLGSTQYKISILMWGSLGIVGSGITSPGTFTGSVPFYIYTGDWAESLAIMRTIDGSTFSGSFDPASPGADHVLSSEVELDQELFGATTKWRYLKHLKAYTTNETPIAGVCAGTRTTAAKTVWNGESKLDISNMIVTASLP